LPPSAESASNGSGIRSSNARSNGFQNSDVRPQEINLHLERSNVSPVRNFRDDDVRSQQSHHFNQSEAVSAVLQNMLGEQKYEELPPAERYPTRLTYFNAWSLPIQKYSSDALDPYQPDH
jgi:hypothetical protein